MYEMTMVCLTRGTLPVLVAGVLLLIPVQASSVAVVGSIPAPGPVVRGVAFDGRFLWCSDEGTDSIYRVDPSTGETLHSFGYDILEGYGGLEWDPKGFMWVAERRYVYRVDPWSGSKLGRIHAPGC